MTGLGDFLRSRRARVRPEDVGLPQGIRRRRVPGLRREELAQLAGVSMGYYVRLEQGQGRGVSDGVLDAIARALRLDPTERDHLHRLARPESRVPAPPEKLRPGIRALVAALTDVPAIAVGRRADILAWNPLAHRLLAPHLDYTAPETGLNFVRLDLLDPRAKDLYADWPAKIRDDVSYLQIAASRYPNDAELKAFVAEMRAASAEFARLWSDPTIGDCATITRVHRVEGVGEVELTSELLRPPDDEGQGVCMFHAAPGSAAEEAMRGLAEVGGRAVR